MADVKQLRITQVRSVIGSKRNQRETIRGLGLRRLHQTVTQPDRPEIRGMIAKVAHLVEVREAEAGEVVSAPAQPPPAPGPEQTAAGSIEQHPADVDSTPQPDRPSAPAAPGSDETLEGAEAAPDTGSSGMPSSASAPGKTSEEQT